MHCAAAHVEKIGAAQVVDLLLRRGADDKTLTNNGKTAADVVWSTTVANSRAREVERVRKLLANAPADRHGIGGASMSCAVLTTTAGGFISDSNGAAATPLPPAYRRNLQP